MRTRATLCCLLVACSGGPTLPPKPDAAKSTVTVDRTTQVANQTDEITVLVSALTADGAPAFATGATISMSGPGNEIAQSPGGTDDGGLSGRVRTSKAETKTISVTLQWEGTDIELEQKPVVTFTPGGVYRILFTTEPSNVQAGMTMSPVRVTVFDGYDNVVTAVPLTISLRLVEGTPGAVMTGGTAKDTVDGGVTFDMLSIDRAGTRYGMQARQMPSPGWAADSVRFDVTP